MSIIAWRLLLTAAGRALPFAFALLGRAPSSDSSVSESMITRFGLPLLAGAATGGGVGMRACSSSSESDTRTRVGFLRAAG